MIWLSL